MDDALLKPRLRSLMQTVDAWKWTILSAVLTSALLRYWWKAPSDASERRIKAGKASRVPATNIVL